MAISFDAASSTINNAANSQYSWSHTISGSNPALLVGLVFQNNGAVISNADWGGAALTAVPSGAITQGAYRSEVWYLAAPGTGTKTITVNLGGNQTDGVGLAISLNGADQTSPVGNVVTNGNSSTTSTCTATSATNNMVVDFLARARNGSVPTTNQTLNQANQNSTATRGEGARAAGAASVVMTWTSDTVDVNAQVAVEIVVPSSVFTAKFRKTLSPIGTKVGSRQLHDYSH